MSRFRKGSRCDGCGIISGDPDGYYQRGETERGNITSQGRNCEHDYCERCEDEHAPRYACRKCGFLPATAENSEANAAIMAGRQPCGS